MAKKLRMSGIDGWCSFSFHPCQSRFKAIFPDGLIIKKGGMASGLKKAETNEHEPKLFKVAGGIRPVMAEVSSVDKTITITCTLLCLMRSKGVK